MIAISWDVICSIVTAAAAVVALGISVYQVRLSNRQQLLNRRIHLWTKAHALIRLCEDNRSSLEKRSDGPDFANDLLFQFLTNNSLLYSIGPAVGHVLEQEYQSALLVKLEELKEAAFEVELVFKGRPAKILSSFIADYAALLMTMYQYQIMLRHLSETSERFHYDLDQAIEAVGEQRQRDELYSARENLLRSFDNLSPRTVERIVAQCRLTFLS